MRRQDLIALMKDRAYSAKFFVQPPFRTKSFLLVTALCVEDLLGGIAVDVRGLQRHNLLSHLIMATAMLALIGAWAVGFLTHKSIHRLFEDGQIEKLEEGSALDKVLSATSNSIKVGLFFASFAFLFVLFAAAVLYPRHL